MTTRKQTNQEASPAMEGRNSIHSCDSMMDLQDRMGGMTFNNERWSNLRQTSVGDFAADWVGDANEWRVQIIDDPKLCRNGGPMVLMRQSLFHRIHRGLTDMLEGRMALSAKVEDISEMTTLFYTLKEEGAKVAGLLKVSEMTFSKFRSLSMSFSSPSKMQEAERYRPTSDEMAELLVAEEGADDGGADA
ncbi:MAG: hypothetical protein JKY61_11870 [Planctomycetes bacterium]|nr:hypothetical protein [Planctomycetota bacterium]